MGMTRLNRYTSILDWAIDAHSFEDTPTNESRKRVLLKEINKALGTNYSEQHMNNWLAGRKPTPQRVWRFLAAMLIDLEVGFKNPTLGRSLKKLLGLNE